MSWINEIYYGTLSGGVKNGLIAFTIDFSGEDPANDEEIASAIGLIVNHPQRRCGKVYLCGKFSESEAMERLAKSLSDCGMELIVSVEDATWRHWFAHYVSFISVQLHTTQWVPIKFSELIYDIYDADQVEPLLPAKFDRNKDVLFARSTGKVQSSDLFKFIAKSQNFWNVFTKTNVIKEILYKGVK